MELWQKGDVVQKSHMAQLDAMALRAMALLTQQAHAEMEQVGMHHPTLSAQQLLQCMPVAVLWVATQTLGVTMGAALHAVHSGEQPCLPVPSQLSLYLCADHVQLASMLKGNAEMRMRVQAIATREAAAVASALRTVDFGSDASRLAWLKRADLRFVGDSVATGAWRCACKHCAAWYAFSANPAQAVKSASPTATWYQVVQAYVASMRTQVRAVAALAPEERASIARAIDKA